MCNSDGVEILRAREKTRAEARYKGNRALFRLLVGGWKLMPPQTPIENSRPALMPHGPV